MKLVSVSLALASVILVPCYGQQEKTKATAPAVKAQAKPIVSAEKRFARRLRLRPMITVIPFVQPPNY
jgi:hypothetical protein